MSSKKEQIKRFIEKLLFYLLYRGIISILPIAWDRLKKIINGFGVLLKTKSLPEFLKYIFSDKPSFDQAVVDGCYLFVISWILFYLFIILSRFWTAEKAGLKNFHIGRSSLLDIIGERIKHAT